jgi:hypothetical protein
MSLKFINTIEIKQMPNGETVITGSSRKVGQGQPSAQMRAAVKEWYDMFHAFFTAHKPAGTLEATAVQGYVAHKERVIANGASLRSVGQPCGCNGVHMCERHFDFD